MYYVYEDLLGSGKVYRPEDYMVQVESLESYVPLEEHVAIAVKTEIRPQEGIIYPYGSVWLYTPCKGWYQDLELWHLFGLIFEDCERSDDANT